ncbi:hypothetical protein [Dethiosulfovibrio salsuginis]|nr:hypothetical protein [Dethiosulfovibrio salsuginis]
MTKELICLLVANGHIRYGDLKRRAKVRRIVKRAERIIRRTLVCGGL